MKSKVSYGIREKQTFGESSDISETTMESWMEQNFVADLKRKIYKTWTRVVASS